MDRDVLAVCSLSFLMPYLSIHRYFIYKEVMKDFSLLLLVVSYMFSVLSMYTMTWSSFFPILYSSVPSISLANDKQLVCLSAFFCQSTDKLMELSIVFPWVEKLFVWIKFSFNLICMYVVHTLSVEVHSALCTNLIS
jgi:hypothetical protein